MREFLDPKSAIVKSLVAATSAPGFAARAARQSRGPARIIDKPTREFVAKHNIPFKSQAEADKITREFQAAAAAEVVTKTKKSRGAGSQQRTLLTPDARFAPEENIRRRTLLGGA